MKRVLTAIFALCLLAVGFILVSCTDGTFEGSGGSNIIITRIPSQYYNKFVTVSGSVGSDTVAFKGRAKISSKGRVSAPLYIGNSHYTGSGSATLTISVYNTAAATDLTTVATKSISVNLYSGGCGVYDCNNNF
jgi:hypothetical protein